MPAGFDTEHLIALAAVLGFASGVRLYAVLLITGLVGHVGWVELPPGLQVLAHPWVLLAAGFMFVAEFFADKLPFVDSIWDGLHTLVRIPAGAALAAMVFGGDQFSALWPTIAAILGGSLAATSHITKTSTRAAVNTSPEPVSNVLVSTAEDVAVGGLLALVFTYPWIALAVLVLLLVLMLWMLRKLWRLLRRSLARLLGTQARSSGSTN